MADTPDLKAIDRQMARDDGGYAFPVPMVFDGSVADNVNERGMSLRDYLAGQALVAHGAILAHQLEALDGAVGIADDIARACYAIADAMLAERSRG